MISSTKIVKNWKIKLYIFDEIDYYKKYTVNINKLNNFILVLNVKKIKNIFRNLT